MSDLFSKEAAEQLQILAETQQKLIQDCEKWFASHAFPLFDQCQTMEDYKKIRMAMPKLHDCDQQFLDLPGNIQVNLAFAVDAIRQKEILANGDHGVQS